MSFVYVFLEFSALRIKDTISGWYRISGAENTPLFQGKSSTRFFHHVEIPAGKNLRNFVPKQGPGKSTEITSLDGCIQSLQPVQGTFQLISLRAENVVNIRYN